MNTPVSTPAMLSGRDVRPLDIQVPSRQSRLMRGMSRHVGVLYVLPATILLLTITIIPFGYLVYNSFTNWNLQRAYLGKRWIGLANYALLFVRQFFGKRVVRSLFLLPLITTPVVVGLTWRMLYNSDLGMINYFLESLHLPAPVWLASTRWAPVSVVITDTWAAVPFVTLMFVAGLQAVPMEPKEAARVDGASKVRVFFDIVLALIFRATDAIRMFDLIYVMTSGGPANATQTLNMYAFKVGFQFLDIGYGSALAVALMAICMVISFLAVRFSGFDLEGTRS